VRRREFLLALPALSGALAARAQTTARPARILALNWGQRPASRPPRSVYGAAFVQAMRELGHVEGKSFVLEPGYTEGNVEELAKELAALKPDVILSNELMARLAHKVAPAIPIVLTYSGDPVASGFAKSLARPGGNVTGLATLNLDTSPKLLELLLAIVPRQTRVPVVANPVVPSYAAVLKNLQNAAQQAKVDLLPIEARDNAEIYGGFSLIAREKLRSVVVLGDPLVFRQRKQIADLALRYGVASVYPAKEHVEAGGLISYGINLVDIWRRAATFVDKILKGAKPGDLPIQQATTLELVINMKTARFLGLTIPQSILLRADQVIE
jgi:putative ABC transport system substrate-binding protein